MRCTDRAFVWTLAVLQAARSVEERVRLAVIVPGINLMGYGTATAQSAAVWSLGRTWKRLPGGRPQRNPGSAVSGASLEDSTSHVGTSCDRNEMCPACLRGQDSGKSVPRPPGWSPSASSLCWFCYVSFVRNHRQEHSEVRSPGRPRANLGVALGDLDPDLQLDWRADCGFQSHFSSRVFCSWRSEV